MIIIFWVGYDEDSDNIMFHSLWVLESSGAKVKEYKKTGKYRNPVGRLKGYVKNYSSFWSI
jgi:hypothetical protein